MYHILAPQRQRQYGSARWKNQTLAAASFASLPTRQRLVELAAAVLAGIGGVEQQMDLAAAQRDLDLLAAGDQIARPAPRARAGRAPPGAAPPRSARRDRRARSIAPVLNARASARLQLALGLRRFERRRGRRRSRRRGPGARARTSGATCRPGRARGGSAPSRGACRGSGCRCARGRAVAALRLAGRAGPTDQSLPQAPLDAFVEGLGAGLA